MIDADGIYEARRDSVLKKFRNNEHEAIMYFSLCSKGREQSSKKKRYHIAVSDLANLTHRKMGIGSVVRSEIERMPADKFIEHCVRLCA